MVKGEDAVRRKRNKVKRKRMRNSESSVSARVASIIASKRRRKAGSRRMCEGMCFSLPTPDDPFNDHLDHHSNDNNNKNSKEKYKKKKKTINKKRAAPPKKKKKEPEDVVGVSNKFLLLCLNAIQEEEEEEEEEEEKGGASLLSCTWGLHFWRRICSDTDNNVALVDYASAAAAAGATREQTAWLVSTAAHLIARKEKQRLNIPSPFLLYLVPSQEKAIQVRSVCKPLKPLGIHTVSLHQGASLDHQVHGFKSCEPEFVVATPDRLLELVSLKAIDIRGVALLVLDGLKNFLDFGFMDKVKSIRGNIFGDPHIVVFSDCCDKFSKSTVQNLSSEPICRFSS